MPWLYTPLRLPTLKTIFSILHCHSGLEADDKIQSPGHYGPLCSMAKSGAAENPGTVKGKGFPYRPLGPELIPVYRQSARRWLYVIHPAVGRHYFPPGLLLPSQQQSIIDPWPVPSYTARWEVHRCNGCELWTTCPRLLHSYAPSRICIHDLLINALPVALMRTAEVNNC